MGLKVGPRVPKEGPKDGLLKRGGGPSELPRHSSAPLHPHTLPRRPSLALRPTHPLEDSASTQSGVAPRWLGVRKGRDVYLSVSLRGVHRRDPTVGQSPSPPTSVLRGQRLWGDRGFDAVVFCESAGLPNHLVSPRVEADQRSRATATAQELRRPKLDLTLDKWCVCGGKVRASYGQKGSHWTGPIVCEQEIKVPVGTELTP